MTHPVAFLSNNQPSLQSDLFRPSLNYPSYPYDEILTRSAERYPEHVAISFRTISLTYRELDALVDTFTNALRAAGIQKGECVCLFMNNRPEFIICWFAIIRLGAVVSPLNPSYKEREVAYQLENSTAVAIVVQDNLLALVEAALPDLPRLKQLITVGSSQTSSVIQTHTFTSLLESYSPIPAQHATWAPDDLITLPYSSGTTGMPKGVMLSQQNLLINACQSLATARITAQDRMLVFLPLYHIYGLMLLGTSMMSGATLVLMERFHAGECLQLIQEHGITLLYTVPQILSLLSDYPQLADYNLHTVRYAQCGAAPVPIALARRFQECTHIPVVPSYGLTEAAPGTHSNPTFDPNMVKLGTIGLPIHDTKQKIVDLETGQRELGVGEEGELLIQGPQVMLGYWKAPEATRETLRDGWLYTGDIGWKDEQGYVTLTDRKKELIKYKGFSVAPAQLEALLLEHPAVADVAVIARADTEAGEVPKAFVVLKESYTHLSPDELLAWANGKLATYKNIHAIEFISAIPRNPSGKILRRVLREQEQQKQST